MRVIIWICILWTNCVCFTTTVTYDEVVNVTGLNCYPSDTCRPRNNSAVRLIEEFDRRACRCDVQCAKFDDCCLDAKSIDDGTRGRKDIFPICHRLRQYGGAFMIMKCPDAASNDPDVRSRCENGRIEVEDSPMIRMPVTNIETGTTYKNIYCAICNGNHDTKRIQMWQPRIECSRDLKEYNDTHKNLTADFVNGDIHYNDTLYEWGISVGSEFFNCKVDPVRPDNLQHLIRLCRPTISNCSKDWRNETVEDKCRSYTAVVRDLGGELYDLYRNPHCAICNGVPALDLQCVAAGLSIQSRRFGDQILFDRTAFAVLLDFNPDGGKFVGEVTKCRKGELYDPFFKVCRNVVCGGDSLSYRDGKCVPDDDDSIPDVHHGNGSRSNLTNSSDTFDREFLECPKWQLARKEVLILKNESVYVVKYERVYDSGLYRFLNDSVIICAIVGSNQLSKFSRTMAVVTFIGLGLSLLCLILHFAAFLAVPDLRNISGKNLASLVVALFLGYLAFVLGMFATPEYTPCVVISVVTYYSFLAVFFWMNIIAFDVWQTLRLATTELRVSGGKQVKKFACYSLYGWSIPGIFSIVSLLLDFSIIPAHSSLRPEFGMRNCWFGHRMSLSVLFGGPTGVLLALNVLFFTLSTVIIVRSTRNSLKYSSPTSASRRSYKLYLRLAIICGLTWIWGFIAGYFDVEILWYVFIFFNTLMGVFVFMTFTCAKKVRNALKERVECFTKRTKKSEMLNASASSGSGMNSNDTRKSSLIPTDSGGSTNSNGYGELASYKSSAKN